MVPRDALVPVMAMNFLAVLEGDMLPGEMEGLAIGRQFAACLAARAPALAPHFVGLGQNVNALKADRRRECAARGEA